MSRSSSVRPIPAASRLVTLDLMLKTFMNSAEFTRMERKNWEAVARLVPGTTAREVKLKTTAVGYLFVG